MMKNGVFVICANNIEEAERDLEMMKLAASRPNAIMGAGSETWVKANAALEALKKVLNLEEDEDDCCECCDCEECEDEEEGDELSDLCDTLGAWFANKLYAYAIGEAPVEEVRRETTKAIREVRDFMN